MITTLIVVAIVSGALVIGALWGLYGPLPDAVRGFVVAMAGGALIVSATVELIEPASADAAIWAVAGAVALGAVLFSGVDWLVDEVWGNSSGGGLLAAITLDGVPENLALGVALIGAAPVQVAALAGSILLSNLPEAAGGAKQMAATGQARGKALGLWVATAVLLSTAAIAGNLLLADAPPATLALIRSFAAGAVVASLATEVFPEAFREGRQATGLAAALGVVVAFVLGQLGS